MRTPWMRTAIFASLLCCLVCAAMSSGAAQSDALVQTINQSKITTSGSPPFHLKAVIQEPGNKDSDYKGEIEEYWAAPNKWRRIIKSEQFSQTLIMNGQAVLEQHTGDYYPFWIRDLVTALFDLGPEDFPHDGKASSMPDDVLSVPMSGGSGGGGVVHPPNPGFLGRFTSSCRRNSEMVGIAPVQNTVFMSYCTQGDMQLLTLFSTPSFHAQFLDYKAFQQKQVARRIVLELEPGTRIEAQVAELSEVRHPDDRLFAVQPADGKPPAPSVRVEEAEARKMLLNSADIAWIPVREGKTSGVLSLVAYVDKEGHVRETYPLNSDNPFPLDQARKEVSKWRFQPLLREGVPVQMETLLTFAFKTDIVNPIPLLPEAEGRKMATTKVEPRFTSSTIPKGTPFTLRITVDEKGNVVRVENLQNVNASLFDLAASTLRTWHFKTYKVDGKPERFSTDITFHVQ